MMDIDLIKQKKKQCEAEIHSMIALFQRQTGCTVCAIVMDKAYYEEIGSYEGVVPVGVKMDVRV